MHSIATTVALVGLAAQAVTAAPWTTEQDSRVESLQARTRWNRVQCYQVFQSYNGGHNVKNSNSNKLIDASDATIDLDVLDLGRNNYRRQRVPQACMTYIKEYNAGHNTVNNNENKLIDLSGLNVFADILSRDLESRNAPDFYREYDGGHNVYNNNENKLVDLSNLDADVNVLSKRDVGNQECFCRPKPTGNCNPGWTPPRQHDPRPPAPSPSPSPRPSPRPRPPTCDNGWTWINEGHNIVNNNENKLLDLSNLSLDVNILSNDDGGVTRSQKVSGTWKCTSRRGCCVQPPKIRGCSNDYVFVNKGHNVVNNNENKLLDLSNLDVDINVLNFDGGRSDRNVKGSWQCDSPYGCCGRRAPSCPGGSQWYSAGSNVYNNNENKGVDLSNLTLDINILSVLGGGQSRREKNGGYKCQSKWGCCAKVVDGGHNVVNNNENKGIDASGLNLGLNVLSGSDGKGLLGNKGGLLGLGVL